MIEDGPHTADILRAQRVGRDQDLVEGVAATVVHCLYTPDGTSTDTSQRQQTTETGSLFAPAGAPVPKPTDKIVVRGREGTYRCVGVAEVWVDLEGQPCGYQQRLERVAG